jgi:hypothetical protein
MTESNAAIESWTNAAREAVGVFDAPDALESAVDALETAGFDRAAISVLAGDEKVKERVGRLYTSVSELADDPRAPQEAFVSKGERVLGEAAAVSIPIYIGGAVGAFAVVASGGLLAAALAAAIAGGAAGAGLGALLARAIDARHTDHVVKQLALGGMVLWVGLRDAESEKKALDILNQAGAHDVHVHEIQREWSLKDIPLSTAQPDPLL